MKKLKKFKKVLKDKKQEPVISRRAETAAWYEDYRDFVASGEREPTTPRNPRSNACEECKILPGYYTVVAVPGRNGETLEEFYPVSPCRSPKTGQQLKWLCPYCSGIKDTPAMPHMRVRDALGRPCVKTLPRKVPALKKFKTNKPPKKG